MTLHMLSFRPDFGRLMRLAERERLLPPGNDVGYALHAVFAASFGNDAPKPFALFLPGQPGGGPAGRLLAYSALPLDALVERAATFADPAFSEVLQLDAAAAKTMPARFAPGTRLGFRVRVRPVVRTGKPRTDPTASDVAAPGRARERDAYAPPPGDPAPAAASARGDVYVRWLADQLAKAGAKLERAHLDGFRFSRVMTRDRSGNAPGSRAVDGPDATLVGELAVTDGAAFAAGLARGIGRYRAFGFGMLLLTPPSG